MEHKPNKGTTDLAINTFLVDAIKRELKDVIGKRYEDMKADFIKNLDRDKDMAIAGIVLNIQKMIDVQSYNDRLIITVKTKKE